MNDGLRFSPRPNRAHEIKWRLWGRAAFDEAQKAQKPVLLAISGVWCHWCHVMDETSYSDPEIIKIINDDYIPIRVDTDQRPDVNSRYNLGGWPTTAILTPKGALLTGGTYIPPAQLKRLLQGMARVFADEHEGIVKKLARAALERESDPDPDAAGAVLTADEAREAHARIIGALRQAYDPVHGGFGREPKFPMVGALELLLAEYLVTGDTGLREMVETSLGGMSGAGMYDPVEGGFFRYSTTRDWSVPHYEKMLEDNAGLLGLLAVAFAVTADERWATVARDVHRFLRNVLYLEDAQCWAGSQDADEEYYRLPTVGREARTAPFVDRTIYVNLNAMLARALLSAGVHLDQEEYTTEAVATLASLWRLAYRPGEGMAHFIHGGEPQLFGQLTDNVAVGRALLQAYQVTGEGMWLDRARDLATIVTRKFRAPAGGFLDFIPEPGAAGRLAEGRVELEENSAAVLWLCELARVTGETDFEQDALTAVGVPHHQYEHYGVLAAVYAQALAAVFRPWVTVTISGPEEELGQLHRRALAAVLPQRALSLVAIPGAAVRAVICIGSRCLRPLASASELGAELERWARAGRARFELDRWGDLPPTDRTGHVEAGPTLPR